MSKSQKAEISDASGAPGVSVRFRIGWCDGRYTVSIPSYDGGEVVRAEVADALLNSLKVCSAILAGYARKGLVLEEDSFRIAETQQSITVGQALDGADAALASSREVRL